MLGTSPKEEAMTAYNVVRFKVKPGQEQKFIELHKSLPDLDGMKDGALIKTCLLYTSPSPRDRTRSRMPSSA